MTDEPNLFARLDDPNPPPFGDDAWQRVQARSKLIARRRRFALGTSGTAAVIALVIVAIVWSVVGRNQGDGIATVGSSTSAVGHVSTTSPSSVWVTVVLHLDRLRVFQDQQVTGTVTFDNHRPERVVLPAGHPTQWDVVVGVGAGPPLLASVETPTSSHVLDLAPGTTTVPFTAIAQDERGSCPSTVLFCPPLLRAGAAKAWFVTDVPVEHLAVPAPVALTIEGRGGPARQTQPCPIPSPLPSEATGSFCGPPPTAGNGLGTNGRCTGRETGPPCGPGVIPGKYYTYTLPGTCDGRVVFDGRHWISELPPPSPEPDMYVWMRLDPNGGLGFISPAGAVGFRPDTGQAVTLCAHS